MLKKKFRVGFGFGVDRVVEASKNIPKPRVKKKAKVYFIQLGTEAKMKSLKVIEVLLRQTKSQYDNHFQKTVLDLSSLSQKKAEYLTRLFSDKKKL
ncbi:MAG: hypothetical protein R3B55_01925 [Candidatus Paceibacterota bacterium]